MNIAELLENLFVNFDIAESITFLKDEDRKKIIVRLAAPLNGQRAVSDCELSMDLLKKCRVNQDDSPILEAIKLAHASLRYTIEGPDNDSDDIPPDENEILQELGDEEDGMSLDGIVVDYASTGDPRPRPGHVNSAGYMSHFSQAAREAAAGMMLSIPPEALAKLRAALLGLDKPKPPEPDPDDMLDAPAMDFTPKPKPPIPVSQVRLNIDTSKIKLGPVMKPPIRDSPKKPDDKPPFAQHD